MVVARHINSIMKAHLRALREKLKRGKREARRGKQEKWQWEVGIRRGGEHIDS